jgi:ribosomal protein S21
VLLGCGWCLLNSRLLGCLRLWLTEHHFVQIVVGPDEPQDSAMKRFRREVMSAGLVQEVRRRRYFENSVDARKRKEKDCRIKTRRDRKFPPRTYSQTMAPEPSPFNDMFGTPDDLFADVLSGGEENNGTQAE